jgi:uncharacterized integral membrane protein
MSGRMSSVKIRCNALPHIVFFNAHTATTNISGGRRINFTIVLLIIAACLAVVFIIQNVAAVTVGIFFWEISLSLALLIFFVLALGFVIGWFLHSFLAYRKIKQEVAEVQKNLRSGKK